MSVSLDKLLHYWRASLQDSIQHIDAEALALCNLPLGRVVRGAVPTETCRQLWADAEGSISAGMLSRMNAIPVLISPVLLCAGREHGQGYVDLKNVQTPVWLACQCDRNGQIRLNERLKPQDAIIIDRDTIAPLVSNVPTYTTLEEVKAFLDQAPLKPVKEGMAWEDVWKYVLQLFEKVFRASPENWTKGPMVNQGCFVAFGERPLDTAIAIRAVYERLLDGKEKQPPLLSTLLQKGSLTDAQGYAGCRSALKVNHVAQMGGNNPLNKGQRQALSAVLSAPQGALVAVNGPPGTGKTTLLQSVVGSLWVQSALKGEEPSVILASSTNNQAITNILDSFKSASLPPDHRLTSSSISRRWIPKVEQYGLFLPSEARSEVAGKDYQVACCPSRKAAWTGLPEIIENKEYVEQAEAAWISAAQLWDHEIDTVREGLAKLQEKLICLDKAVRTSWSLWEALHGFVEDKTDATSVRECLETWRKRKKNLDSHAVILERQAHQALALFHTPLSLLSWIPPIRRMIWSRVHAFLSQHKLIDKTWTWETVLTERKFRSWLTSRTNLVNKHREEVATKITAWNEWEQHIKQLMPSKDAAALALEEELLQSTLDLQVRTEMFLVAGRYWEGRWILEMKDVLDKAATNPKVLNGWSKENCEARWRRFAKLTPCLVATAYTAPRLFEYFKGDNRSLLSFADLLIVEEAGQVAPHVGGALFALAQKALVIGDTQQIEPVWGVSPAIDDGNIDHYGLSSLKAELETRGMLASEGSVMRMAQTATAFASAGHEGMFLDEHWRCRRSTIAYCNDLAYNGKLTPKREDGASDFPPLGYAHVAGRAERRGTSWANPLEAHIIAAWIAKNQQVLAKGKTLGERIAIVTPFKAQISVLQKALQKHGMGSEKIAAGTIHTLQGAERDVVLFSPVYSADTASGLFFDRTVNMLNVAVSRAKESFLVFGDMRLFHPERSSPSGLLARHLFKNPDCEILDVEPTLALRAPEIIEESVERIDTLDGHRRLLRQAIEEARDRLLIISPYLSIHALDADGTPEQLQRAAERGVKITVCYDPFMNKIESGQFYPRVQAALDVLAQTAVDVRPITPIHNKTLAVDASWISEGSFNWLSASRQQDGIYRRQETSILYRGGKASIFIEKAWKDI